LLLQPKILLLQPNVLLTEVNILLLNKNVRVIPILTNDFVSITKPFFPFSYSFAQNMLPSTICRKTKEYQYNKTKIIGLTHNSLNYLE